MLTPALWGMDGITRAALVLLTPFYLLIGFAITAAVFGLSRRIMAKLGSDSRLTFALISMSFLALLHVPLILGGDTWPLLLAVIEFAAIPAVLLLMPPRAVASGEIR